MNPRKHYRNSLIIDVSITYIISQKEERLYSMYENKFEGIKIKELNSIQWKIDPKNCLFFYWSRENWNPIYKNKHFEIDPTENNFIKISNKLNSPVNRENTEFNLFTEIVLKVCEKNKTWLTNCLFTSNPNYKRHDINRS